nr:putative retrotransposon protein [Tanacetum cinerariifolium]
PDKLDPRSFKSIFVGYPKETIGYSFYSPSENKVFIARNAEFFESKLLDLKASGSVKDLELIQEEDTNPSSSRTRRAPDRMCLYVDAEEHELGDLGEPANYKAALMDPESKKWLDTMNVEMQSMKDNDVWVLVELPPNAKTVGSKWLFKKNTDMDGAVYIFKARLVAKGFTQTYGVDYEETFSPVADIRAIRILIAIAAYYDYKIWQMDVKTAFLNGHLSEEVYMEKHEEKLKLSKSQGASTPAEKQRMQNIPYASAVGSIMYAVRFTHPDVAFAQNMTSCFQQNPGEEHWTAVKNILMYLRNTKDMFLVYGGNMERELKVSCYTDAGYLTDADNLKSQTGYVFVLNGGAVYWKSIKQSIFATSSTDAEYIAAFDASKEAVWIRKFISGLGIVPIIEEPISMYCDNTGAIAIAKDDGVTKGSRHFHAKVHYLRETIKLGDVKIEKVHTDDNLADPFIKALVFPKHSELTRNIGLLPASSFMYECYVLLRLPSGSCWKMVVDSTSTLRIELLNCVSDYLEALVKAHIEIISNEQKSIDELAQASKHEKDKVAEFDGKIKNEIGEMMRSHNKIIKIDKAIFKTKMQINLVNIDKMLCKKILKKAKKGDY